MTCNCYCIKKLGNHQNVITSAIALTHTKERKPFMECVYVFMAVLVYVIVIYSSQKRASPLPP